MTASAEIGQKAASRFTVVGGFVLATLFTSAVTLWTGFVSADRQATRNERMVEVNKFIDAAAELDPLVSSAVAEIKVGDLKKDTREKLKQNLLKQRSLVDNASGLLPNEEQTLADDYQMTLAGANGGLSTAHSKLTFGPFAQAVANLAYKRIVLIRAFRKGAGFPVSSAQSDLPAEVDSKVTTHTP